MTAPLWLRDARLPAPFAAEGSRWDLLLDGGVISARVPHDPHAKPNEPTWDLDGRWLLPAFVDSHLHLHTMAQWTSVLELDRSTTRESLAARLGALPPSPTGWRIAKGWHDPLADTLTPDPRQFLDQVSPEVPAWVFAADHHRALLNSAALRAVGVSPEGHEGVLLENELMAAWESVPPLPADVNAVAETMNGCGIVAATSFDDEVALARWRTAVEDEALPLRVRHSRPHPEYLAAVDGAAVEAPVGSRESRFFAPWVKGFLDGTLGSRTAWLLEPYADAPTEWGDERVPAGERDRLAREVARGGWSIALHAIGDAAVDSALDMIEAVARARAEFGVAAQAPDRVEHAQLLPPDSLERWRRSGAVASMQPCHLLEDAAVGPERFGDRCSRLFAAQTLLEANVPLCFGSDAPIETVDPWIDVRAAVDRVDRAGRFPDGWIAAERISWDQAILGRTAHAAATNALPEGWGTLEPGAPADLQILGCDDPRRVSTIDDAKLESLSLAGEWLRGGPS